MDSMRASEDSQTSSVRSPTKRTSGNKRWTSTESRFFIRFMASQVEQGFKVDKGFKPQAFHAAIKAIKQEFGIIVTESNVSNHLRTIKKRWARIKKLKELSGMGWDDGLKMIIMGETEYKDYIKIHPQDEPFLNKPIEDHDLLEAICGNDQASGRRAVHFGDDIGMDMYDNENIRQSPQIGGLEDMSFEETNFHANVSTPIHTHSESSEPQGATSSQTRRGKGKRKLVSEVEAIQEMNNTFKEALGNMNSTRTLSFAKDLMSECMKLKNHGYSGREINRAYDWLMGDEMRAISFLAKDEELRMYWAEDFFGGY
ncbi:Myb/SANT-like domain-containing protein [Dioscorea alata]|uniref:Myb/SANT-like domain-containing protein n=6 Tax=Dioscorea alata TaxID=55571 RepID=A0ACB7VFC6_DIOAL|nr:Myb/SANT-like domain-containing protein [Dioscorea alata]KAH7672523.1 Myb/SANT-like domain-containing protein [Dioscorea alata]KAH7672524.1 Myb/SANT-like domain-containing protein [Dioscorea alata]